jgi:ATP-dependent Clp protease ATP-binding subunit ClpC
MPMFERYTQSARRVIFHARDQAMRHGSPYIESEHLLLGILRENDNLPVLLGGATHDVAECRTKLERISSIGQPLAGRVEVPLSTDSKRILILAAEEAETLNHDKICLARFLLGMLRVEKSTAAGIVLSGGATALGLHDKAIQNMRWADGPD